MNTMALITNAFAIAVAIMVTTLIIIIYLAVTRRTQQKRAAESNRIGFGRMRQQEAEREQYLRDQDKRR
jgi:hypothetical protein